MNARGEEGRRWPGWGPPLPQSLVPRSRKPTPRPTAAPEGWTARLPEAERAAAQLEGHQPPKGRGHREDVLRRIPAHVMSSFRHAVQRRRDDTPLECALRQQSARLHAALILGTSTNVDL